MIRKLVNFYRDFEDPADRAIIIAVVSFGFISFCATVYIAWAFFN